MSRSISLALRCALIVGLAAASPAKTSAQAQVDGAWSGVFTWGTGGGIEAIHTVLLPTGKLLFWQYSAATVGGWDPVSNQFFEVPDPSHNVFCGNHVFLPDGRLFVPGGQNSQGTYHGEHRADIYDPYTNTWANTNPAVPNVPPMGPGGTSAAANDLTTSGERWYPSATMLGNGDVLVTSGDVQALDHTNRRVQIYQYATNSWRELTGALRPANDLLPEYPRIFLAPDGRAVMLADFRDTTEFLDMSGSGSWSYLSDTLDPNIANYGPAVMYDTGKIAYMGGGHQPTKNISILDLNQPQPAWRYGGGGTTPPPAGSPFAMAQGRRQNNATILADGSVLLTGGTSATGWNDPNGLIAAAEIWDPVTERVSQVAAANPSIFRGYHSTATLLPDGRVLVTGGEHSEGGPLAASNLNAEIYSPPYLFNGPRPTITAAPSVVELGDTIFVATPNAADIAKALWIIPGAVTHAHNWTQRANVLDFQATGGGVNIDLPASGNEAPPGYYMLFLVNAAGVPSMAQWVRATLPPDNADFDGSGVVDGADFLVWQRNAGAPAGATQAQGDATHDGLVNGGDLAAWEAQFGAPPPAASVSAVIPEPRSVGIAASGAAGFYAARFRRRSRSANRGAF